MKKALWRFSEVLSSVLQEEFCYVDSEQDWEIDGISIDSRTVKAGDLFIALKGKHFDGHEYIEAAFSKGAVAVIAECYPPDIDENQKERIILVEESIKALWLLAAAARKRSTATFIAVTGSVGKTGVKEALYCVFSAFGICYASPGSYNNHIGLPLSLASMDRHAVYGIFELGMNHRGEIQTLSNLLRPHISIITTIEVAHAAFFSSIWDIADAKAEIFSGGVPQKAAVLNKDNEQFDYLCQKAYDHGVLSIYSFSFENPSAYSFLRDMKTQGRGIKFQCSIGNNQLEGFLPALGRHYVMNILAVLTVAAIAGIDIYAAVQRLSYFQVPKGRGRLFEITLSGERHVTIIDDSYNASPASMKAGLEVLSQLSCRKEQAGRSVAILGDMLELGEQAEMLHAALASEIISLKINTVIAVGPLMKELFYNCQRENIDIRHYYNTDSMMKEIDSLLCNGDYVMIKGSAGTKISKLVKHLCNLSVKK